MADETAAVGAADEVTLTPDQMTDEQLASTLAGAREQFRTDYADHGAAPTDEQLAALRELAQMIEDLKAEAETRETALAERRAAAAALAADVEPVEDADADEPDEDVEDEADEVEGEEPATEAAATPVAPATTEPVAVPRQYAVRTSPAAVLRSGAARAATSTKGLRAVDGTNADLDYAGLGEAMRKALDSMGSMSNFATAAAAGRLLQQRIPVAELAYTANSGLRLSGTNPDADEAVMRQLTSTNRLPGGSLVAAGWCSPSEIDYNAPRIGGSSEGTLVLPEVAAPRGGWKFRPPFDFATALDAVWTFTEQQVIDGTYGVDADGFGNGTEGDPNVKPCIELECPEWDDVRLDVSGYCVTDSLLTRSTFPELLADFMFFAAAIQPHRRTQIALRDIIAGSDAITFTGTRVGAVSSILDALRIQGQQYRSSHALPRATELEVLLPTWVREAFRSDLERRLGNGVDAIAVADQAIDRWFATERMAVQWLTDFQPLAKTATAYPATVQAIMYAAGTWTRLVRDVVSFEMMFSSELLARNNYSAAFVEWADAIAKRGNDSRVLTIPFCADGATHAGVDIACDGTLVTTP